MFQKRPLTPKETENLFEDIPLAMPLTFTERPYAGGIAIPGMVLAGGAARSLFDQEATINDYDFFFVKNGYHSFADGIAVARMVLKEAGFENTYTCPKGWLYTYVSEQRGVKIQLITEKEYDSVEELLDSFDLTAAMFAVDFTNHVFYTEKAVKDVNDRKLTLHKLSYPVSTFKRIMKYIMLYGFRSGDIGKQFVDRIAEQAQFEYDFEKVTGQAPTNSIFSADAMRQYID